MSRAVKEWVGKTPDTPIPERVKLRLMREHNYKDYITGLPLIPGQIDFDHIVALCNGGENRESNLAPVNRKAHKEKTKQDVKIRAKTDSMAKSHFLGKPKRKSNGRGFQTNRNSKFKRKMDGSIVLR